MAKHHNIFIYGFSIFSMFFGSGNLVFPLQIGYQAGSSWFVSFFGLFLTGIVLPFLGLFVIKLHKGDYSAFFGEAGSLARLILPLFTLSLLGSFGVVPRCITVAHGGLEYIYPELSLVAFSLVFCTLCYIICLNDRLMISILGKWLTPALLISLIFLISFGIIKSPEDAELTVLDQTSSFAVGFFKGYETMDLFAAFFFSSLVFKQIQVFMPQTATHRDIIKFALKSSLIGAGLLSLVYLGFVYLGAHYRFLLTDVSQELLLPSITSHLFGSNAALLIGIIIVLSCLTTAVALNNIYARYLCVTFKLQDKTFPMVLLATTTISFAISLLDFKGIAAFLSPLLMISYPSLIALTFLSIILKGNKLLKITAFYGIIFLVLVL